MLDRPFGVVCHAGTMLGTRLTSQLLGRRFGAVGRAGTMPGTRLCLPLPARPFGAICRSNGILCQYLLFLHHGMARTGPATKNDKNQAHRELGRLGSLGN